METVTQAWERMVRRANDVGFPLPNTHLVYRTLDLTTPIGRASMGVEALSLVAPSCPYAASGSLVAMEIVRGEMCWVVDC